MATNITLSEDGESIAMLDVRIKWTGLQIAIELAMWIVCHEKQLLSQGEEIGARRLREMLQMDSRDLIEYFLIDRSVSEGAPSNHRPDFVKDWHVELARQHLREVWPDVLVTRGLKTVVGRAWENDPTPEKHLAYLTCWAQPSYDEPYWSCPECGTSDYCDHSQSCGWVAT